MRFARLDGLTNESRTVKTEKVMNTRRQTAVRELDHRHNDGIDVRLLWNPDTGSVSIAVCDERFGELLAFDVDPAEALTAFHHPYAYAPHGEPARPLIHASER